MNNHFIVENVFCRGWSQYWNANRDESVESGDASVKEGEVCPGQTLLSISSAWKQNSTKSTDVSQALRLKPYTQGIHMFQHQGLGLYLFLGVPLQVYYWAYASRGSIFRRYSGVSVSWRWNYLVPQQLAHYRTEYTHIYMYVYIHIYMIVEKVQTQVICTTMVSWM